MNPDLQKLERLIGYLQQDSNNPQLLNDIVATALSLNDERTKLYLDRLLAVTNNSPEARFQLATWHAQQRQWQQAADILQGLFDEGLDNPGVRFNLAIARACCKQMSQVYELLQPLVTNSAPPGAHVLLARACHHLGRLDEARLHLQNQLETQPLDAEALGALALVMTDSGDHATAKVLARKAVELAPANYDAQQSLVFAAIANADLEEAQTGVEALLQRKQDDGRTWVAQGMIALSSQRVAEGEEALKRAVQLLPTNLGIWNALGWARLALNKLDEAENTFRHALDLNHNFSESHGGLACILLLKGQLETAQHHLKVARRLDRDSFSAMFGDSLTSAIAGDEPQAAAKLGHMMQQPLTRGANTTLSEQVLKLLRKLPPPS